MIDQLQHKSALSCGIDVKWMATIPHQPAVGSEIAAACNAVAYDCGTERGRLNSQAI